MNFSNHLFILLLSILIMLLCCNKNPTEPEGTAPEIPPVASFVMDFSDFSNPDTASAATYLNKTFQTSLTFQNWWWSAFNVGVWNVFITFGMAIPTGAFLATLNESPAWNSDGYWEWTRNFSVAGIQHTAELHGMLGGMGTKWEMYISKNNAYQNFLWYSGEASLSLTEGFWIINKDPNTPTALLQIDWHRNVQDSTADIRYTNIVPDGPENGGYIFYGTRKNDTFDAFYDIFNKGKNNFTNIEWNRESKEGHVKDPDHFSDDEWHCWDNELKDKNCQ